MSLQFKIIRTGLLAETLRALLQIRWGAWALIALYLSLISGVIVALQYDYATPYYSSSSIDILIPYGAFFRSLHFYTSQFFFFFTCIHLAVIFRKSESYKKLEWYKLTGTIPLIILLLFTGYILRGDSTGESAGMIAESIVRTIPIADNLVDSLFLSLDTSGLRKVYAHHVIGLDLALLLLLWQHLRIYRIKLTDHLPVCGAMLLFSVFVLAPMDPESLGTTYISGPWFFLGLQELLRYLNPFIAGVLVPCVFVGLLFAMQPCNKNYHRSLTALYIFLVCYAILSTIASLR